MSDKKAITNLKIPQITNDKISSILDVLDFKDESVKKFAIITHNIEQLILIEDRVKAYNIIKENPINVESGYTINGDRIKMVANSLSDFRARDDGKYFFEDKSSKIKSLERELSKISTNKPIRNDQIDADIDRIRNQIDILEREKIENEAMIESIKSVKENNTESIEKKVGILEKNVLTLSSKKEEMINSRKILIDEKNLIEIQNFKDKNDFLKSKDEMTKRYSRLDCEDKLAESKKSDKVLKKRILYEKIQQEIPALGAEIPNPRSLLELNKEKRLVKDQMRKAKEMDSKEDLQLSVKKLKKRINKNDLIILSLKLLLKKQEMLVIRGF